MRLAIREPYLKRMADASFGVRVDKAVDLVRLTPVCGNLHCCVAQSNIPPGVELKLCGRCKAAFYCSSLCQRHAWKQGHRLKCTPTIGGEQGSSEESGESGNQHGKR